MDLPPVNIEDYPAIKRHLNNFGKDLIRSDRGDSIYNLRNCAYMQDFFKQKIIFSEISKMPCFHLDNESFFAEATTFIMTGLNLDFLLTLLNSKPVTYIFKKFYAGGGLGDSGLRYKKAFLELLPLPNKILIHKILETCKIIKNWPIRVLIGLHSS